MSDALLGLRPDDAYRLVVDAVTYEPVHGDAALGVLLFSLRPQRLRADGGYRAGRALEAARRAAAEFARLLEVLALRGRPDAPRLPATVSAATARGWVDRARAAVPAAERDRFAWRLQLQLGDDPWGDGSPACGWPAEQFGLFEAGFDPATDPALQRMAAERARPEPLKP